MTRSSTQAWTAALSFLTSEMAAGFEPLARRLDLLMEDNPPASEGSLEPNGYSGLARRGPFDRLLLSEWMLAAEEPDEFARRVVTAELSFLEVERTEPRPPGRYVALVDSGPDQLGACRLGQLAALLVLARRAEAHDVPLEIGVLQSQPGTWLSGDITSVMREWLRSRWTEPVAATALAGWFDLTAAAYPDARPWIVGGAELGERLRELPADSTYRRDRFISIAETAWTAAGVAAVTVTAGRRSVELTLPESQIAVRALRGRGLFSSTPISSSNDLAGSGSGLRFPRFHSSERRLICRGETADVLQLVTIPENGDGRRSRVRTKRLPGPVLAASVIGQRTVALVVEGDMARIVVLGKRLAQVHTIQCALDQIYLDQDTVAALVTEDLAPLHFWDHSMIVSIDGAWWRLHPERDPQLTTYCALASRPGRGYAPRAAALQGPNLHADGYGFERPLPASPRVLLGSRATVAVLLDDGSWTLRLGGPVPGPWQDLRVEDGATVLGVTAIEDEPALVIQSPGGHLLRIRGPELDRTLTKASQGGSVEEASLHPTLPLLALLRDNGRIDIVDVSTSRRVTYVDGSSL